MNTTFHPTRAASRAIGLALASLLIPGASFAQQNTIDTVQAFLAVDGGGNGAAGCGGAGASGNNLTTALNTALGTPGFDDEGVGLANRRVAYRFCDSLTTTGANGWTGDSAAIPQESYDRMAALYAPDEVFAQMDNAHAAFDLQTGNVARRLSLVRLARRERNRRDVEIAGRANARDDAYTLSTRGPTGVGREDQAEQILLGLQNGINAGDGTEGSGAGFFVNGRVNAIKGDGNASERGSDGFGGGFTIGMDTPIDDDLFAGIALGYTHIDTHYDGSASESDLDALTVTGYGAFYPDDALYVDGSFALSWLGFQTSNDLIVLDGGPDAGSLEGDANGVNVGFDVGVGYALDVAELAGDEKLEGLVIEPSGRLSVLYTYIEDYEQGGAADASADLLIDEQETVSVTLNLGFRSEYPVSTRFGVLTPYVRAAYVAELNDENDDIDVGLAAFGAGGTVSIKAQATDTHYGNFGAGVAATLGQGLNQFIDYDVIAGHDNVTIHQVTAGIRLEY